jgi:GrpB-like predicted nucleotidyltransferase (UPF0157 family)
MTTEKLFSYGTLQYDNVQLEIFSRTLIGHKDILTGYTLSTIEVTVQKVVELSGESTHKTLFYSGDPEDQISGVIFDVTSAELELTDKYEGNEYKRILVTLKSNTRVWAYVSRAEELKHFIEIVEYNPDWPKEFEAEAARLNPLFKDNLIAIYHMGSTSVPGLPAKPTIDFAVEVKDIHLVDTINKQMAELGYEAWGEYGITGRRFFVKGVDKRTHHVHAYQTGSPEIKGYLVYRDYLIAHPEYAKEYVALKTSLAKKFRNDRGAYAKGKRDFIDSMVQKLT